MEQFRADAGDGKPCIAQMTVCVADDPKEAQRIVHECWPTAGLKGRDDLMWEVKTPELFEEIVANVRREDVAKVMPYGKDADAHLEEIQKYLDAGFDQVYVHQVGPDQDVFVRFYERDVLPRLR